MEKKDAEINDNDNHHDNNNNNNDNNNDNDNHDHSHSDNDNGNGNGNGNGNDDDNTREAVQDTLNKLVAHFGQTIQSEVLIDSFPTDITSADCTEDGEARERERPLPVISEFFLDRLISISLQTRDFSTDADRADCDENTLCSGNKSILSDDMKIIAVLCEWIRGYEEVVRSRIFSVGGSTLDADELPTFDVTCIPVLQNYEFVLSKLLLRLMATERLTDTLSSTLSTIPPSFFAVFQAVRVLCTDITLLTINTKNVQNYCNENEIDEKNHLRRNMGLPAVLRILRQIIEVLQQIVVALRPGNNKNQIKVVEFGKFMLECNGSLRLCAVTLLAFEVLVDDDDDADADFSFTPQIASAVFLPQKLSPSLSTSVDQTNRDLSLVQRILKHSETLNNFGSSTIARRYLDEAIGSGSSSYNDVNDGFWTTLLSSSEESVSTIGWIDPNWNNTRLTLRIVQGIWRIMASLIMSSSKQERVTNIEKHTANEDIMDGEVSISRQHRERRDFVLKTIGYRDSLLKEVRAHFFGRNLYGIQDLLIREKKHKIDGSDDDNVKVPEYLSNVVQMGRRGTKTKKKIDLNRSPFDDPIYERMPCRTASTVNTLKLLLVPKMIDNNEKRWKEYIFENIFPIYAALLDSNNAVFGALGAAGFLHAIDFVSTQETTIASIDIIPDQLVCKKSESWSTFAENTLTVLDRALETNCGRGHTVVAIGRVQSRLFEVFILHGKFSCDEERKRTIRRRRSATEKWLLNLERSLYRPTTERQQLELLVAGVIPFLSQMAMDEGSDANGMELLRLALAALLPLTTNSNMRGVEQTIRKSIGKKTQMASMVALINLIYAAHPIIASHGGKIMSHLLTTAASIEPSIARSACRQINEANCSEDGAPTNGSIKNMAVLIAAIILVLDENEFASEVLESIEDNSEDFQQNLVSVVMRVREVAADLARISNTNQ